MGELKQSRFDARKPSIGNRSRRDIALMFARLSFSLSAILLPIISVHPLPTRMRMLFISGSGAGSTRGFHERIRERTYSDSLLCVPLFLSPRAKSRGILEDGPGASASANTGLSSRAIHLHARARARARRDYLRNEKHSSCCAAAGAGKFLART